MATSQQSAIEALDKFEIIYNTIINNKGKIVIKDLNEKNDLKLFFGTHSDFFWICKHTEDHWEIHAKISIKLCYLYLNSTCQGDCGNLHLCKDFLLSGKYCPGKCKFGFSHNIDDAHNHFVLSSLTTKNQFGIVLLRSSFPRLCSSFVNEGTCSKMFCGYVHLCSDLVAGSCTGVCSLTKFNISKVDGHNYGNIHNKKVFDSFGLSILKNDRLITNTNILTNKSNICNDPLSESVTSSDASSVISGSFSFNKSGKKEFKSTSNAVSSSTDTSNTVNQIFRVPLCTFYLDGNCKNLHCPRLHMCKEFLINGNKCNAACCKFGFSHDPFDENNKKLTNKFGSLNKSEALGRIRKSFPRLCQEYQNNQTCRKCKKIHICKKYASGVCENTDCSFSHDFKDEHNLKVLKIFSIDKLKEGEQWETFVTTNILFTKVAADNMAYCSKQDLTTVGKPVENRKNSFSLFPQKKMSIEMDKNIEKSNQSQESAIKAAAKRKFTLCFMYLEGNCFQDSCPRLHMCKEFLTNRNKCNAAFCKFGFSHDPFDENNKKLTDKFGNLSKSEALQLIRKSFPRLCKKYENNQTCGDCMKIHICKKYASDVCKDDSCPLSHDFKDEHNLKVLKAFAMDTLKGKREKEFLVGNILFTKGSVDSINYSEEDFSTISELRNEIPIRSNSMQIVEMDEKVDKRLQIQKNKSEMKKGKFILCSNYLDGNCSQENCARLHICRNLVISASMCGRDTCHFGFSHQLLDKHNKEIIDKKGIKYTNHATLLAIVRNSFPRICKNYNQSIHSESVQCNYLHLCKSVGDGNKCIDSNCIEPHSLQTEHNQSVLQYYGLENLKNEKYLWINIMIPKCKPNENRKQVILDTLKSDIHTRLTTAARDTVAINTESKEKDLFSFLIGCKAVKCSLADLYLLSFFYGNKEKANKWFQEHLYTFRLETKANEDTFVCLCLQNVRPCHYYWRKGIGCQSSYCHMFHICKKLLLGESHSQISCSSLHDFVDDHNKSLVSQYMLSDLKPAQLVTLLQYRYPRICIDNQNDKCSEGEHLCSDLHICYPFMKSKCKKHEDICGLKHESGLHGVQASRLMKEFHISGSTLQLCVMLPILKKPTVLKHLPCLPAKLDTLREAAICNQYLSDECEKGDSCFLIHTASKLPYIWQYKYKTNASSWSDFPDALNIALEEKYSNPASEYFDDNILRTDFCDNGCYKSKDVFVRRLSTQSSVNGGSSESGLTEWRWYWQKSKQIDTGWELYSEGVTSEEIETFFLANHNFSQYRFKTDEFSYLINFEEMNQRNIDERYNTGRAIRRRPLLKMKHDIQSASNFTIPSHWSKDCDPGIKIRMHPTSDVYQKLQREFMATMETDVSVLKIEEICNSEFWQKYDIKKHNLKKKLSDVNEMFLYHGTSHTAVQPICVQNFDWRLNGKNAVMYGQGSYFSKTAEFSHRYTSADEKGIRYMFVAKILAGKYTKGESSMRRPPTVNSTSHELFDSCVNNIANPSIFVVFERDQYYPNYLISYKLAAASSYSTTSNQATMRASNHPATSYRSSLTSNQATTASSRYASTPSFSTTKRSTYSTTSNQVTLGGSNYSAQATTATPSSSSTSSSSTKDPKDKCLIM